MPAGLVGPLESLSAYRHVDGVEASPVNFMHLQMKVAGRPVNVLSRISEAPPDYTGRTNIIAHHVVVTTRDRAPGGPAAVLRQSGFAIEAWDGEVRRIPEPKAIPPADSPLRIAQNWAEQAGDSGWAGVVASVFESRVPGPTLYLIYQPQQNRELLTLVDEATCLLPESKRWNATFSTYTRDLPPGVQCRLRCLVAGSPEVSTIPPSAMTLDLATGRFKSSAGEFSAPPPGPLVEAAQTGKIETLQDLASAAVPRVATQSAVSIPAGPSDSFEPAEPNFTVPPPIDNPKRSTPPKSIEATSPTRNYFLPLIAAAVLLLCLVGASAIFFFQTGSDELLAELNATAGIENSPVAIISDPVQQESAVQSEPESGIEPGNSEVPQSENKASENKASEAKQGEAKILEELQQLAKKVLDGDAFLKVEGEKSIKAVSAKVQESQESLNEKKKQLDEILLKPTPEQESAWVRAEDGIEKWGRFADDKQKEIDTLKPNTPLKDLERHRDRLINQLDVWNKHAEAWEREKADRPEWVQQVPKNDAVEKTIIIIREERDRLQKSLRKVFDQYEELTTKNDEIEKQHDLSRDELTANLERRRKSHRLAIYFDGDLKRKDDRLRIKPRCMIAMEPDDLKAINRMRIDDGNPIPLEQPNVEEELLGRFEKWLAVMRGESGIVLKLDPEALPPAIRNEYPLLEKLDQFAKDQNATFESFDKLKNLFDSNFPKLNAELGKFEFKFRQNEVQLEGIKKLQQSVNQFKDLLDRPTAKTLDDLYVEQINQTVDELGSSGATLAKAFKRCKIPDAAIDVKIEEHIKSLETLRDSYLDLKSEKGPIDFEATLVFTDSSGKVFEPKEPKTITTFRLFFFPELVYGPPPHE
jgi:hypothetical protein